MVSEMLGHASIAITKDVYGHLLEGDKRVAAESMSQALFGEQLIYALRGVFSYVARGSPRALVSDPAAPFGGVMQPDLGREGAYEGLLGDTRCSRAIRL